MPEYITIPLLIIAAYILGSIPTAVWVGKIFFGTDIRQHGSGNAGTTNVLRTFGTVAAIPVFLIDAGKGYGAVMLSWLSPLAPIEGADQSEYFVFLRIGLMVAAITGHVFPIFASFKGGKGVATVAGCLLAIAPISLGASFGVFVILWASTSYLSLGSIFAALTFPLWMWLYYTLSEESLSPTMMIMAGVIAVLLTYTHKANIKRLLSGNERKTALVKKLKGSKK